MKILCVGDYIEDRYIFGTATRLCPEAPVPVIVPTSERSSDGGAGLVVAQLREFGADVNAWFTSRAVKSRMFADGQMLCRLDYPNEISNEPLMGRSIPAGAFIISDYGRDSESQDGVTGGMTKNIARGLVETGKPCFVDAKHHWHWYEGKNVTIFPNDREATGTETVDPTKVYHSCEYGCIVQKMGKHGCWLRDGQLNVRLPAATADVVDVCGAGDIFMAGFVYAWSIQLPAEDCLRFANALAGESCRHVGTYVVPKAFAEAYLGILRASKESERQQSVNVPGSSSIGPEPIPHFQTFSEKLTSSIFDNFPEDWSKV